MKSVTVLVTFVAFVVLGTTSNGALVVPNAYTLDGVVAENGSSPDGGCPSMCVGMSNSVRRCDCRGSGIGEEAITGVLIDGDRVPNLDPSGAMWASSLLTVMGGGSNVILGFRFSSGDVPVREVVLYIFNCPAWGIGAESIYVYHAGTFPNLVRLFNSLGNVTLTRAMHNCESLIRISIPLRQPDIVTQNYFIEFYSPPPARIQQMYIGEVTFSDQPVAVSTTAAATAPTTTNTRVPTSASTTVETTIRTTQVTELSSPTLLPTSTETLSNMSPTIPLTPTTSDESSTPPATPDTTDQPSDSETTLSSNQDASTAALIGALVAVVIILLLLILVGGMAIGGCFMRNKRRSYRTQVQQLQEVVMERNQTIKSPSNNSLGSLGTTTAHNHHYQKTQFNTSPTRVSSEGLAIASNGVFYSKLKESTTGVQGLPPHAIEAGYADVPSEEKLDAYDIIKESEPVDDSQYSTIDNCIKEKEEAMSKQQEEAESSLLPDSHEPKRGYSLVRKRDLPAIPKKSPELYRDLEVKRSSSPKKPDDEEYYTEVDEKMNRGLSKEGSNPAYIHLDEVDHGKPTITVSHATTDEEKPASHKAAPTEEAFIGKYSEIELEQGAMEEGVYTEVHDSLNKPCSATKKHVTSSGPVILSNAFFEDMEHNPNYMSTSDLAGNVGHTPAGDIGEDTVYSNPDMLDECESIYNAVYSEPILPSMFAKGAKPATKESLDELESLEASGCEEMIYSPIYSLSSSTNEASSPCLLQLRPENIKKLKTLGTGFFGKVLLAKTVGLSLKDLKLSDMDDDKTKSVRVAVKQLRLNPSQARREAFEKELRFMSRLDHPNVVHTVGACTAEDVDTPFIVMEYMPKGDLNQYLQDFESIMPGAGVDVPPASPPPQAISVESLTDMCAQIACAMEYLASKNFIHRDLATRNCLVGAESQIKIADFGMSRNLYESHYYVIKGKAVLPVRWMATECFYGKFSAKTDVWAFGITMWEIFTLAKDIPYEDMDDSEVADDASNLEGKRRLLERPEDCPQDVYAVMLMCWEAEPEDRATFKTLHRSLSQLKV